MRVEHAVGGAKAHELEIALFEEPGLAKEMRRDDLLREAERERPQWALGGGVDAINTLAKNGLDCIGREPEYEKRPRPLDDLW